MKQEAKYTITHFSDAADKAINGATLHPELLSINVSDAIAHDLAAMLAKRDAHENAKSVWAQRRKAVQNLTKNARAVLAIGRDLLKPHLGTRYSRSWDSAGLVGSTEIPRAFVAVKALLHSFKAHFTAHPERAITALGITTAALEALHGSMVSAQNEEINAETAFKTALAERNIAVRSLEKRLRDLFGELKMKLTPMDPRWLAFGFNQPGLKERPETPAPPTVVAGTESSVAVKWDRTPRADLYHVWIKKGGAEEEPKRIGTRKNRDFVLDDQPLNTEMEIGISALNSGGESAISEWVKVKTKPTEKAESTGEGVSGSKRTETQTEGSSLEQTDVFRSSHDAAPETGALHEAQPGVHPSSGAAM